MKKTLTLLLLLLITKSFSQDYELRATPTIESEITYKNGTSEKGLLWLANSAFNPRLKKDKKGGSKKIDYKTIDKITTNSGTENERIFQYLHHNYNKYKIFVELIYTDKINIYIASKDGGVDLFYSDYDRETMREKFLRMKHGNSYGSQNETNTIELPNGKKWK